MVAGGGGMCGAGGHFLGSTQVEKSGCGRRGRFASAWFVFLAYVFLCLELGCVWRREMLALQ